jgi:hypothetical protein
MVRALAVKSESIDRGPETDLIEILCKVAFALCKVQQKFFVVQIIQQLLDILQH